ncbi:MAG: methylamine utilization protein [Sulfuricella sp.]|nr:methylamine utilization protein [Sulfuricella sp.]
MKLVAALLAAALSAAVPPALAGSLEATVATPAGKPAEDSAVVLEALAAAPPRTRPPAPAIEQRDREFRPYLTIVQTGTAVEFPNRDPFKHHVYSFSPAKVFEIKLYAGKPAQPVIFDKAGEVALGCNIHDWMEAYVLVVNTRHFAKTDAAGHALISDVPPGRYRLQVWHPRQKAAFASREIEIGTAPLKLDLVMNIAPRIVKAKPPIDSDQY